MNPLPDTPELANFTTAMRGILTVSKAELNAREETWKKEQMAAKKNRKAAEAKKAKARADRVAALASKKS
jgi:hypothetical protein